MTDRHVDDILSDFRELPLPQQMRAAAGTVYDANERHHSWGQGASWSPFDLEQWANTWEAEDRAKAEQDAMVEELAKWLSINIGNWPLDEWHLRLKPDYWHDRARELMGAGWRKGSSDE